MTSRSKGVPARDWKQVRIPPEESSAVAAYAAMVGLAFPAALRLVLRQGLGWPTPASRKPSKGRPEGPEDYDIPRLK